MCSLNSWSTSIRFCTEITIMLSQKIGKRGLIGCVDTSTCRGFLGWSLLQLAETSIYLKTSNSFLKDANHQKFFDCCEIIGVTTVNGSKRVSGTKEHPITKLQNNVSESNLLLSKF